MAKMMRAAILDAHGEPFRVASVSRPEPAPGEVLVKIAASGVNPLDIKIQAGAAAHARHPAPAILGLDLAGTVELLGKGVTRLEVGDEVYGLAGGVGGLQGSLAEYATVDADLLAHKPDNLSMREAAALPLVAITAWEGLVDRVAIRSGQTLLVLGGKGGVGHVAVQIARARGLDVYATGSAGSRETIEGFGATFIDRDEPTAEHVARLTAGRGYDVVYDTVGGAMLDAAFEAVCRFGHVTSSLGWGSHALAPLSFKAATYSGVFALLPLLSGQGRRHHSEILEEVTRMVQAGTLRPRVDAERYSLTTVAEAYAAVGRGAPNGKAVVEPST